MGGTEADGGRQLFGLDPFLVMGIDVFQNIKHLLGSTGVYLQLQAAKNNQQFENVGTDDIAIANLLMGEFLQEPFIDIKNLVIFKRVRIGVNIICWEVCIQVIEQIMVGDIKKITAFAEGGVKISGGENAIIDDQGAVLGNELMGNVVVDQPKIPFGGLVLIPADLVDTDPVRNISKLHKIMVMVLRFGTDNATVDIGAVVL